MSLSGNIDKTRPEFHPGTRAEPCGITDINPMSGPHTIKFPLLEQIEKRVKTSAEKRAESPQKYGHT